MRLATSLALCSLAVASISEAATLAITYDTNNEQIATVTSVRGTFQASELIGVDLVDYDGDDSSVLTADQSPNTPTAPPMGQRASLIEDAFLNTGILNADTLGMEFTFNSPVFNGPGVDIFGFELDPEDEGNDNLSVQINGNTIVLADSDFQLALDEATLPDSDLFQAGPSTVDTLTELETFDYDFQTDIDQAVFLFEIDLSDFGVADGDSITSLLLGGDGADPTFLAGLNLAPVPEPASIAIWSLLGLGLVGFGYYRVRRQK